MSGRRSADDGHGLTGRELAIVDRLDAGDTIEAVAAAFGVSRATVATMEQRFVITMDQLTKFDRMVRRGDAQYRRALVASGGRYR